MKRALRRKIFALVLSCSMVSLQVQPMLVAADDGTALQGQSPAVTYTEVRDVALQPGGILQGQVVDVQGKPGAGAPIQVVRLTAPQALVASGRTDREGRFQVAALKGGIYSLQTGETTLVCRLWAPDTAPPAAVPAVLLVSNGTVVRGNLGDMTTLEWSLVGVAAAAAIAVPVVVLTTQNHSPASGT
jgi:hypothetical protein